MKEKKAATKQPQESLPWRSLEQQVVRLQKQIEQAAKLGDRLAVYDLQQRLMESEAARLLAVRRAAEENHGKHSAGVDGIKSLDLKERLAMADAIHPKYWNGQPALPVRRVWVPKSGTNERRPLAVLPMIDRCKQALVKLALEPEWEVKFEPHSYGFRPGKGAHDALAAILVAIERQPMFVFDADLEEAFDHIDQVMLLGKLQTYPALSRVVNAWLSAGVMDDGSFSPSETGIAQGGVLSPLLLNIALHGMEAVVMDSVDTCYSREHPLLVRYADDFVILHPDLSVLQQAVLRVKQWLAGMGLNVNPDKTRITHTLMPYQRQVGFDFLGFNIHQEGATGKVNTIVTPGQDAHQRHLAAIDQRLQQLQMASQARVIEELNPLIIGWATHYNGIVSTATLSRYDDLLQQRLINWASRRHPGKARDWLLNRYWRNVGGRRSVFATHEGVQLRAYQHTSILKG